MVTLEEMQKGTKWFPGNENLRPYAGIYLVDQSCGIEHMLRHPMSGFTMVAPSEQELGGLVWVHGRKILGTQDFDDDNEFEIFLEKAITLVSQKNSYVTLGVPGAFQRGLKDAVGLLRRAEGITNPVYQDLYTSGYNFGLTFLQR